MKKSKKNNDNMKLLIVLGCILLAAILIIFLVNNKKTELTDEKITEMKEEVIKNYGSRNIEEMDMMDVSNYFGIETDKVSSSFFLSDFMPEDENDIFNPTLLIVFIKADNVEEYERLLKGYLESQITYHDGDEEVEKDTTLYENAIVKRKDNYTYLVMGREQEEVVKIIEKYL